MRSCFSCGQRAQRAHVVEPVGELDEDDADVLRHGQEHLADVLGLLLLVATGAELGQLGDAVDEVRDLRPEALLDVAEVVLGVLGDVVEQRRRDRHRVEAELGQDLGHGQRMGDVRLAAGPLLALVGLDGEAVGPFDGLQVGLRVVLVERREQVARGGLHGARRGPGCRVRGPGRGAPALDRGRGGGIDGHGGQCTPRPRRLLKRPRCPARHARGRATPGGGTTADPGPGRTCPDDAPASRRRCA